MNKMMIECVVWNMQNPKKAALKMELSDLLRDFSIFSTYIHFGYFPPKAVLNEYFSLGLQNEGMGNNIVWHAFCLTNEGYDILFLEMKDNINKNLCIIGENINSITSWKFVVSKKIIDRRNLNETRNPVKFYLPRDSYGELSNFANYGIEMEGIWWKTVEHYYQAQKFTDADYREKIANADTPRIASILGRTINRTIRDDWEFIKNDIMYKGVLKKFETHKNLREILISTGNRPIIENSPSDYYWGIGQDGTGKNHLGKILEKVRTEIKV